MMHQIVQHKMSTNRNSVKLLTYHWYYLITIDLIVIQRIDQDKIMRKSNLSGNLSLVNLRISKAKRLIKRLGIPMFTSVGRRMGATSRSFSIIANKNTALCSKSKEENEKEHLIASAQSNKLAYSKAHIIHEEPHHNNLLSREIHTNHNSWKSLYK